MSMIVARSLCIALLAAGCGGAAGATPTPAPRSAPEARAEASTIEPRVVHGEWTHARVCGAPGQAAGIVAHGDRVIAVCDDLFGSRGAERFERSSTGWTPASMTRTGAALAIALDDDGEIVTVTAEPTDTVGELALRMRAGERSEEIRRVSALEARGELVVDRGRTIFVQGLRSHSVLERGAGGWRQLAVLDAFGRTSSALDRDGRLHVLHPLRDVIGHRVVDRDGRIANGELHESARAGVMGACEGVLHAALDTMRGVVHARFDGSTWEHEDLDAPGAPAAIAFDSECRVFIADREGVLSRGAGGWVRAPFPPDLVDRVAGIAATDAEVHVLYERDTSPMQAWIATAALAEP